MTVAGLSQQCVVCVLRAARVVGLYRVSGSGRRVARERRKPNGRVTGKLDQDRSRARWKECAHPCARAAGGGAARMHLGLWRIRRHFGLSQSRLDLGSLRIRLALVVLIATLPALLLAPGADLVQRRPPTDISREDATLADVGVSREIVRAEPDRILGDGLMAIGAVALGGLAMIWRRLSGWPDSRPGVVGRARPAELLRGAGRAGRSGGRRARAQRPGAVPARRRGPGAARHLRLDRAAGRLSA